MKRFLIALQFLTIFPVKIKSKVMPEDIGKSLVYFPLVGLLLGFLLLLSLFILSPLPRLVSGALILTISIIITGGIHLDGFADTCDGLYGVNLLEKRLEIMKDSRIGVMGVIGLVSLLLIKFALIVSIPIDFLWKALIVMLVFSRWSQVLACFSSPYARKEGKGKYFVEGVKKREIFIASLFTLGLFLILIQLKSIILFLMSWLVVFAFIKWVRVKIKGMTGDTVGAANEIAEVAALFFFLVLIK